MPRSAPPTSPLHHGTRISSITEALFPDDMELVSEATPPHGRERGKEGGVDSPDSAEQPARLVSDGPKAKKPSTSSPELSEVSSLEQEEAKEGEVKLRERGGGELGEGVSSPTHNIERRRSYQMATEEDMETDSLDTCFTEQSKYSEASREKTDPRAKDKLDVVKRSASSAEKSSPAAIELRKTLGAGGRGRAARVVSSSVITGGSYPLPSSINRLSTSGGMDSAYSSMKNSGPAQLALDRLIDREISTGSYSTPLIGCIPPSALKYFAEKIAEEKKAKMQTPLASPSHSQSGKQYTDTVTPVYSNYVPQKWSLLDAVLVLWLRVLFVQKSV